MSQQSNKFSIKKYTDYLKNILCSSDDETDDENYNNDNNNDNDNDNISICSDDASMCNGQNDINSQKDLKKKLSINTQDKIDNLHYKYICKSILFPQFKNISPHSSEYQWHTILDSHFKYNNDNANYLSFKEIDCYKNKNITITQDFQQPIIYRGFCKSTKALQNWNIDNIPQIFGDKKVAIEKYMMFEQLINHGVSYHVLESMQWFIDYIKINIKIQNNNNLFENNNFNTPKYYMGEISLKKFKNKNIYDYIKNDKLKRPINDTVIFSGGKYSGSATHLHLREDYIINQVIGTKIMYFINPNHKSNINNALYLSSPYSTNPKFLNFYKYPNKDIQKYMSIKEINDSNFCNIEHLDHSKHSIYKVVLHPGDSLTIPPWWLHNAITYDDFTFSFTHKIIREDKNYWYNIPQMQKYNTCYNFLKKEKNEDHLLMIIKYISNYFKINIKKDIISGYSLFIILILILLFKLSSISIIFTLTFQILFNINIHFLIFFVLFTIIYCLIVDLTIR
jgi:hypothetical protein